MRLIAIAIICLAISWSSAKAADRQGKNGNRTQEEFWMAMCVVAMITLMMLVLIWALLQTLPAKS